MPGALLVFGCGKLVLLCSKHSIKLLWMDKYLVDVLVMGSLLGILRPAYYVYCWIRYGRIQNPPLVIKSVSKVNRFFFSFSPLYHTALVLQPVGRYSSILFICCTVCMTEYSSFQMGCMVLRIHYV